MDIILYWILRVFKMFYFLYNVYEVIMYGNIILGYIDIYLVLYYNLYSSKMKY